MSNTVSIRVFWSQKFCPFETQPCKFGGAADPVISYPSFSMPTTHSILMVTFPGEPGLDVCTLIILLQLLLSYPILS